MSRSKNPHADRRPRVECPGCHRSIVVTFNAVTGEAYIRSHVKAPKQPCAWSRRTAPAHLPFSYGDRQ